MDEQIENEKKYLLNTISGILPTENPFVIYVDDDKDKELFIISSGESFFDDRVSRISKYRSLFDTILDLGEKISYSLEEGINYAYSEEAQKEYSYLYYSSDSEKMAYYYIENALFRIESMWDILAQICNIEFEFGRDIDKIYYNRIFSNNEKHIKEYWEKGMPEITKKIIDYFNEEDDTKIEGKWEGNHNYVNTLRNNMTHKFSISRTQLSEYAFGFKDAPALILKRVCEEYATVGGFVCEMCELILKKLDNENP